MLIGDLILRRVAAQNKRTVNRHTPELTPWRALTFSRSMHGAPTLNRIPARAYANGHARIACVNQQLPTSGVHSSFRVSSSPTRHSYARHRAVPCPAGRARNSSHPAHDCPQRPPWSCHGSCTREPRADVILHVRPRWAPPPQHRPGLDVGSRCRYGRRRVQPVRHVRGRGHRWTLAHT